MRILVALLILILVVSNVVWGILYFMKLNEAPKTQIEFVTQRPQVKIVNFLSLFINKVLKSNKEISPEDKLMLEGRVRDLQDPEILDKWQKFIASSKEPEIQKSAVDLLEILVNKIYGIIK